MTTEIRRRTTLGAGAVLLLALLSLSCGTPPPPQADANPTLDANWWKGAVIYEVYPRSFGDSNGDGVGDLEGIIDHLDYLQDLGVDGIWITPFYPSPQVDFGYDVSDYTTIDPQYGTMADFDRLVAEAGKRHIKIVTDLVLNHTSDQHPWFLESSSSRTNSKADWYVWVDGKRETPPNNWLSIFGHSAWEWDEMRQQYYYHAFYKQQPDLNWRNLQVRAAMYDIMRGWMKRGVAGFRLDAVPQLFEDPKLTNEKYLGGVNAYGDRRTERVHTDNLPEVHGVYRELRQVVDAVPGTVLIGETYLPDIQELAQAYGAKNDELQLPMDTQYGMGSRLSAEFFRSRLREAETDLNGHIPLFVFDNHDNRRSWNRFGDGKHDAAIARLIATLLLTPRDTALLYYGQEIGMQNNDPKTIEEVKDPIGKIGWPKEVGRDGERTPMQWNLDPDAGFSSSPSPWLPVAPDFDKVNVSVETGDPGSLLSFYRGLIHLRKTNAALRAGDLRIVDEKNRDVLSFVRTAGGTTVLVSMNCSDEPRTLHFDAHRIGVSGNSLTTLIQAGGSGQTAKLGDLALAPFGVFVGEVH
ncbi:MAG TPA: alpha-glucosidase [Bryobacteraceae bacterium]|jgi:alpha-glucosidase|nr:alpha-glucosidase [Bryobacteraceae bacterium]